MIGRTVLVRDSDRAHPQPVGEGCCDRVSGDRANDASEVGGALRGDGHQRVKGERRVITQGLKG